MTERTLPKTVYRGSMTRPERWSTWTQRAGDVLVCTPAKCGTTWTQTLVAMLLNGGPGLLGKLGDISPWVDADLGPDPATVASNLSAQTGRRVVKTHTPADGVTLIEGVVLVAVYRHPLDVFMSLRNHIANRNAASDHPLRAPLSQAFQTYVDSDYDVADFDRDSLASLVRHFLMTACSDHSPDAVVIHYSDMVRNTRETLRHLADRIGVSVSEAILNRIVEATRLETMRRNADRFAPVSGTGFWRDDASFFSTGGMGNWRHALSPLQVAKFDARLAELIPDPSRRDWLCQGNAG